MSTDIPWWQTAVIYQIYPRSFQDSNNDGVGDLTGILSRLEYLVELGVDALWISPFYPSPMADFGYDVADYTGVDPMFGTLADFDTLLSRAHALGLRVILDFVPNHSSDQHAWFLASRSSRESPKRDWYLWRDPSPGAGAAEERPPNNWMSHFGGSAWSWDPATQQFYLHSFLPQQPDLNWRNPAVHAAMFDAMRFWLDKGVDGFRMDVLWLLIKDDQFRDNPSNPDWQAGGSSFGRVLPLYTADRPETHRIVAEMRTLLNSYSHTPETDRLLIGEIYLPIRELVRYYGPEDPAPIEGSPAALTAQLTGAQLPFNFHLIQTPWRADALAHLIRDYEAALPFGAWPNYVLGNHDQSRLATRIGPEQARVAAMLLLTLRGTPTLYYGDELGMSDGRIPPEMVQDPAELRQPGIGMGRDPERTPMLWTNGPNAGFTGPETHPWLPVAPAFRADSVESQTDNPTSMLSFYRALLAKRRTHAALHSGAISHVESVQNAVLTYRRTLGTSAFQVVLNLTSTPQTVSCQAGRPMLSTDPGRPPGVALEDALTLSPNEGLLLEIA